MSRGLPLRRRRSPRPFRALVAPAILAAASPAIAEEEIRVGPVEVTATAEPAPPPEASVEADPAAFGTVIEVDRRAGERRDVADLLLEAPGVRVHHAPGGETLILRGTSSDQSLVFLDGIALNAAAGGGVDLRTVPAPLLERITVVRGNEGARYGAGALGGVALLETRALRDEAGGTVSLSAGSFDTLELSGSAWGGGAAASGLVGLVLRRSAGDYPGLYDPTRQHDPSDRTTRVVENNDERGAGALAKGRVRLGGGGALQGLLHGWLGERGLPGSFYQPDDHRRDERRLVGALQIALEPGPDWNLDAALSLRHDDVAVWSDETVRDVRSQPPTDEPGKPWQTEDALGLRVAAEGTPVDWLLLRGDASAGAEWLDSPYHDTHDRERLAAGLAPEIYLGRRVTLAPAVRWDRVGAHEGVSPRIGAAFRPIAPIELRAAWGRTFRAPSFGELFLEQGLVKANPALAPERGWTADAGVVLRGAGAVLQIVAFESRIEDLIVYQPATAGTTRPMNVHDARIRGGEVDLLWRPRPWLQLSGGYSLTRTQSLSEREPQRGRQLAFRPPHRAHGRLAVGLDGWDAWISAAHQSSQYINRANTDRLPGGTAVGAGVGVRLVEAPWAIWISGQVDNAFDALLTDQLGFPQPTRAFTVTLRAHAPGARRNPFEET